MSTVRIASGVESLYSAVCSPARPGVGLQGRPALAGPNGEAEVAAGLGRYRVDVFARCFENRVSLNIVALLDHER